VKAGDRVRPSVHDPLAWGTVIAVRSEALRPQRFRSTTPPPGHPLIEAVYVQWPTSEEIQEALMTESVSAGGPETTTSQDGTDGSGQAGSGVGEIRAAQPGEGSVIGAQQGVTADGQAASPQPGEAGQTLDTDTTGRTESTNEEAGS
jgi:hypothetical protein